MLLAAIAAVWGGLGYPTNTGDRVDTSGLDHELSLVLHQQLLSQGFDYEPSVACDPTDDSHYSCAVTIDAPGGRTLGETVVVSCGAPSVTTGHRCSTAAGYALQ